ncbi:LAMI_0G15588g1_1 [Lachancea mirantina]|uniref:triacylglycerol lipase n=1 Tax=Lachancea mirantina TaxID=1230905 RepID=A0A1G4KCH4_9SACH|nr:LAMI_0G15588g1_1 [Lachancea mirantina]
MVTRGSILLAFGLTKFIQAYEDPQHRSIVVVQDNSVIVSNGFVGISTGIPDLAAQDPFDTSFKTSYGKPYEETTKSQVPGISDLVYERLVYFSKICALTYCIERNELVCYKSFAEGGCPPRLKFCSNEEDNFGIWRTRVELVLLAEKGELGTGYIAVDHERRVVMLAFRGSSTRQDWLSDLLIYPAEYLPSSIEFYNEWVSTGKIKPCDNCMVHRGFHIFLKTLSAQFFDHVESVSLSFPDYKLVITGHSLGAALATLAGIELKLRGYDPLVLTYASPHIFNYDLSVWVDELFGTHDIHQNSMKSGLVEFTRGYFRVIHMQDYITMVPPFYEPAGLEIFVKKLHLPHNKEDVIYRGPKLHRETETDFQSVREDVALTGHGQGHSILGPIEQWLHMYEHRAYFILINTCDDF